MATLISSNDFLISGTHSVLAPFLSKLLRGRTILANPLMNLRTKLIFPKKDLSSFRLCGGANLRIDSTRSGSMETPASEMTCPKSFPLVTPNEHFLGLSDIPYLRHLLNTCLRSVIWVLQSFEKMVKSSM